MLDSEKPQHPLQQRLLQEGLRLSVRREYSQEDLRHRLLRKLRQLPDAGTLEDSEALALVGETIKVLVARDWQSDSRFARERVRHRGQRYGNLRLRQELNHSGVDGTVIEAALAEGNDEVSRCRAVWLKKFGQPAGNRLDLARQMRFLQYRGFAGEVIQQVLKTAGLDVAIPEESL